MTSPLAAQASNPPPDPLRLRRRIALLLLVIGVTSAVVWRHRVTRPDYRLARGQEAIGAKDWDAAEHFATRLEATGHPDHAHLLRGESQFARRRPDLALAALNRVKPDGPLGLRAAVDTGKCQLELRDFREAYRTFALVTEADPRNLDGHRGLAAAAYDMGQLGAAIEHLQKVADLDPSDARPHRLIGLITKDMSQLPEAVTAYREALRRGLPDGVRREVRGELSAVLVQQAQFADALAVLDEETPAGNDAGPEWFATRAASLRGIGKRNEAVELVDVALGKHPTAGLLRLRGQLLLDDGRGADAVAPLEQAVKQTPTDHEARYLLAQAYGGVGRKDEAARELKRVDELRKDFTQLTELSRDAMAKPWDAGVRLKLAELCDRLDKPQLAAMWRSAAAAGAKP